MSTRAGVSRIKGRYVFMIWFTLLLIILSTGVIPYKIATLGQTYPNLDIPLIYFSAGGFLWIGLLYEFGKKTSIVKLNEEDFTVKKFGQKARQHSYTAILTHNERRESGRGGPFNELTIYLADNWFAIRSNEFADYDYLKAHFIQYGQPVSYRTVLTVFERNRFRWLIGGLVLLIGVAIAFGYVAHNPADPNPAQLISVTDVTDQIREDNVKGRLKGVTIRLRAFSGFDFYVSRRNYEVRLETLASAITPSQPVTLLIRQSDFRKKLTKTEPLTFGDKYVDYNQIMVFGVNQGDSLSILTPGSVYEPTHTNPHLRAFLLSILLLLCWTGWVYVDRQPVLRANGRNS